MKKKRQSTDADWGIGDKPNPHALVPVREEPLPLEATEQAIHDASEYADAALSPSTLRAYSRHVREYEAWCKKRSLPPLPEDGHPPHAVALYIASLGKRKQAANTVKQALSALGYYFGRRSNPAPAPSQSFHVKTVLKGVIREVGASVDECKPLLDEHVKKIITKCLAGREDVQATRDRALLALGFSTAARRSELVGLNVEDLIFIEDGLNVRMGGRTETRVKITKTNQTGLLELVPVPFGSPACCPVRLTKKWLQRSGIKQGPVFRRVWKGSDKIGATRLADRAVSNLIQTYAAMLGLDPTEFSGHSLRAGFVTSARRVGMPDKAILAVTRHKSAAMLARYDRDTDLWRDARALL